MYTNCGSFIIGKNETEIQQFLKMYEFVGYQNIFIDLSIGNFKENIDLVEKLKPQTNMMLLPRVTIHTNDVNSLNSSLNKLSLFQDGMIVLQSINKDVLSFAARNSKIDVLSFTSVEEIKTLTPGIISLIKQSQKFIEISFIDLFTQKTYERSRSFREVFKILRLAKNKEHLFIYGGSESNISNIKGPREIISILTSIFEVPLDKAKSMLSKNPELLIKRIQNRNDPSYLEDGVKIIQH